MRTDNVVDMNGEEMIYRREKKEKKRNRHYIDYSLILVVLFLTAFGLLLIYSATSYDYGTYYIKRQGLASGLGLTVMIITALIPYRIYDRFSVWIYLISTFSVLLVLTKLGVTAGNATRWIKIYGGFNLQPAEITKIGVIIMIASLTAHMGKRMNAWKAMLIVLALAILPFLLIYRVTDNLSTAIIVFGIAMFMYLIACTDWKKIVSLIGVAVLAGAGIFLYVYNAITSPNPEKSMRITRIMAWLHPEDYTDDTSYQTLQGLYAIGSGGIMGKGLGEGVQKLSIPEAQNDMIFTVLCEELGLFGAFAVLTLFIILIWRLMVVANNAKDIFGSMLVVGVMAHISLQVIFNVGVVTNTLPNTGISLPFISYGGSSALFLFAEMGIVLSVCRSISAD